MTSLSMASNFYGISCTPDPLNAFLQQNGGYDRVARFLAWGVRGQAVGDTVLLERRVVRAYQVQLGDIVLIEHQARRPVAALRRRTGGDRLPTGVYFLRLKNGRGEKVTKALVMR